jgi:hypothetical protein
MTTRLRILVLAFALAPFGAGLAACGGHSSSGGAGSGHSTTTKKSSGGSHWG